jgi:ACS family allantoate permease-like MFS transporter
MAPVNDGISVMENAHDEIYNEKVKGADAVFAYANAEAVPVDDETNRRLLRKIDTRVLPWLCGLYILQYLDKGV